MVSKSGSSDSRVGGRPYKWKDEFVQKNIVPKALCDKIKDQIMGTEK
jgi:hypothetical protein